MRHRSRKNKIKFKYTILRGIIRIKRRFSGRSTDTTQEVVRLTPHQEKAIKLWRIFVRNKDSQLTSSISTSTRHIKKGNNAMIILQPSERQNGYTMTIFDFDVSKRCLYEVEIQSQFSENVCDYFDHEVEKRMKKVENEKRSLIDEDIDKLIKQEEDELKRRRETSTI